MEAICDGFDFLKAAVNHRKALSTTDFVAVLDIIDSCLPSAVTWMTFVSATQHATANVLRAAVYGAGCKCVSYISKQDYTS